MTDEDLELDDVDLGRALSARRETWEPQRGPDWAELMARAEGARLQRYVFTIAAAAAAVVVAGGAAAAGLLEQAGPAVAALKQLFLP